MNSNGITLLKARAKVNLRLVLEGRRTDGYHLLSMLNATVGLCDNISVRITPHAEVKIVEVRAATGALNKELLEPQKNLASKAAIAFKNKFNIECGLELSIEKNIPSGAGLGGGSSDAAAVLRFLGNEFKEKIKDNNFWESINEIAIQLGADVPFFLGTGFSYVLGIGEELKNFDPECISGIPCLLVYPNAHSDTKKAFLKVKEKYPNIKNSRDEKGREYIASKHNHSELLSLIQNDLEPFIEEDFPQVKVLLSELRAEELLVAGMTGSGTVVFAIPKIKNSESSDSLVQLCEKYRNQGYSAWTTEFERL